MPILFPNDNGPRWVGIINSNIPVSTRIFPFGLGGNWAESLNLFGGDIWLWNPGEYLETGKIVLNALSLGY